VLCHADPSATIRHSVGRFHDGTRQLFALKCKPT
jgi:hypothetical protein